MKKGMLLVIKATLLIALLYLPIQIDAEDMGPTTGPVYLSPIITLNSDKKDYSEYKMGEKITIFATMRNTDKTTLTLTEESKEYEFWIEFDKDGKFAYKKIYPIQSECFQLPSELKPEQEVRVAKFVFSTNDINLLGNFSLSANVDAHFVSTSSFHFKIIKDD